LLLARAQDSDDSERQQLWEQVRSRLERIGLTSIDIAIWNSDGLTSVFQEDVSDERPGPGASWRLRYTSSRGDGTIISVTGSGTVPLGERLPRSDDLFRLFHAICQEWPFREGAAEVAVVPFSLAGRVEAEGATAKAPEAASAPEKERIDRAA
jgi:hypothetical protein